MKVFRLFAFFVKRPAKTTRMASTEEEFRQVSYFIYMHLTSYFCCFACESILIVFELFTQRKCCVLANEVQAAYLL